MSGLLKLNRMSLIVGLCASGLFLLGCDPAPPKPKDPVKTVKTGTDAHDKHDDHDGHGAPHKGQLVEIEGEAGHIELVLDQETGKLTAYVLDGAAKEAVSVPNKELTLSFIPKVGKDGKLPKSVEELKLEAVDAKDGKATQFAGTSPKLKGVKEFAGAFVTVTIGGKEHKGVEVAFPSRHQH